MTLLLRASCALLLVVAAFQTLRIGYADYLFRQDTLQSLERATEIRPGEADFHARLADLDPQNNIVHLHRAVALNPGLSKSWIALGLGLESQKSFREAENCYLQAARWDRQFLPAWTLANFYARQGDAERFWPWARLAAQMSPENIRPLLRLAFGITSDPAVVMEKIIVPRRRVEEDYLYYLMAERLDASTIAARILARAGKEDVQILLDWTNRLIDLGRIREARALWDALIDKGLIAYPRGTVLTNADFSHDPLQAGFDWRITAPAGVNYARTGGGLRIEFSGTQPESFELAAQELELTGGTYRFSFEYRTSGITASTNLRWRLGEVSSAPLGPAENWTQSTETFHGGSGHRFVLLEQRDPGTVRPEGVVYIRALRLAPVQ